ncbi:uncharacterized protein LOC129914934 [Episyrphus balteatus]|uniref:uncharacterized protein LOC129914934 n=1 Tax=Episyrphus balteatus TaxID=286459 RepID=UPI002485D9A6|nr:uncharacterized protein LOC129914934 [Episyrphus balteatus]
MNALKAKRGHVKGVLTRAATFAENIDDRVSSELLETRLESLQDAWNKFITLTDELFSFSEQEDYVDPSDDFSDYESKYFTAQSTFVKEIRERKLASPPALPTAAETVIEKLASQQALFLKKLNEPKKTACSIADHFIGSIDSNSDISQTQKFHYLKSFLRGEPANLIRDIKVSDINYLDAWDKLEKRYDRPNFMIQSHIQSLLSIPNINANNVQSLRKLTDAADETIRGLDSLGAPWRDPWVIYLLSLKLDHDTKEAWGLEVGARSNASIDEFLVFLNSRCDALESAQSLSRPTNQSRVKNPKLVQSHFVETTTSCPKCKADHSLNQCPHFLSLDTITRRSFKCHSKFRCRTCHARHHSLVHPQSPTTVSSDHNSSSSSPGTSSTNPIMPNSLSATTSPISLCSSVAQPINLHSEVHSQVLLPTAIAQVHDKQGTSHHIRLLLDSGSQVSFVTEQTVQRLGLVRKKAQIPIAGVGATPAGVTNGIVTLKLHSRYTQDFIEVQCFVVSKLTSLLPTSFCKTSNIQSFGSYTLADPHFNIPGHIDVLIGADKLFSIISGAAERGLQGICQQFSVGLSVET